MGADRFAVLAPRSLLDEAALAEALSRGPAGARCAVRMGTCEAGPGSSAPGPADALERALLALRAAKSERRGPRVRRFSPAMLEEALLYQDAPEGHSKTGWKAGRRSSEAMAASRPSRASW